MNQRLSAVQIVALLVIGVAVIGWLAWRDKAPVVSATPAARSATSATCGEVAAVEPKDLQNAQRFCDKAVASGDVVGVIAMESMLTLKVTREFAEGLLANRLDADNLIRAYMQHWRAVTGRTSVTVQIEYGQAHVATGDTTLTRGDVVTFR